jgi:hypothetical protein
MTARPPHAVRVHSSHYDTGKAIFDFRLQFLRPESLVPDFSLATLRTNLRWICFIPAIVTEHLFTLAVICQSQIAMNTCLDMATGGTMHMSGKPTAIEKKHHLALFLQGVSHGPFEGRADGTKAARNGPLVPQIDESDLRHG